MSFRFLKISSYYRGFLEYYYNSNPEVSKLSYEEQYAHLMGQFFAWSDNYGRLLAEKGFETMEVIANAMPLQKAWARENGLADNATSDKVIIHQISTFRPEIIYFQDSINFNGAFVGQLKRMFPEIQLYIGNLCAPFSSNQIDDFRVFDYFTVCSPFFTHQLKKYGIDSVMIPHAFDERILNKINQNNHYPESSLIFLGSIFADEGFHSLRREVLENLVKEKKPFQFYGNLPDRSLVGLWKKQASYLAARTLDSIGMRSVTDSIPLIHKGRNHQVMPRNIHLSKGLYKIAKPPLFGLEMYKALSRAAIGFNIHIDCAGDYAANMRLFETTGAGACLLTDRKSNLSDYFVEDKEVVTYDSPQECIEKIRWLTNNPDKGREIARNGQLRTLKEHNFSDRVELFREEIVRRIR
jgi:spore maturation protein CgeB